QQRLPTQGCSEILFHTARAFAKLRPVYFSMLMIDHGWVEEPGNSGESRLVYWKDVIDEMYLRYPSEAQGDLEILSTTPISYSPSYAKDEPAELPIIINYQDEEKIEVRVWENILSTLTEIDILDKDKYLKSLERFYSVANSCSRAIEYIMSNNMLIILDNRKVAHARKPFQGQKKNGNGNVELNPRKILSTHIL
ncbi:MAG: TauD/TfdA family dioxygenase, partial [Flavisolibacter sp.]